jgi:hypothetical protein
LLTVEEDHPGNRIREHLAATLAGVPSLLA